MISNLCQKVQKLTGKSISFHALSKGIFRYSVKIAEAKPFLAKLSPNDLDLFKKRATFSLENQKRDERSAIIPLENPIEIEGKTVFALRLKGVFPQASKKGIVEPYTIGDGFCKRFLEVAEGTKISVRLGRDTSEYSPQGTVEFEGLAKEVETALRLGPEITDILLGFGTYDDLEFNGQPVGFAIYGMEREKDVRIFRYLGIHVWNTGSLPKAEELAAHTGELLRGMHDLTFLHGFPHLGNYGLLSEEAARILDLETSIKLLSVPQENRLALLYLDLCRVVEDFQKPKVYEEVYDGEPEKHFIYPTALLPFFFWGYFNGDTSLPFVKALQRFMDGNYKPYELSETFGVLPEFGDGWRIGSNFTLVEPTIKLYTLPEKGQIDLENFRSHPFFNLFYEALESVALSI